MITLNEMLEHNSSVEVIKLMLDQSASTQLNQALIDFQQQAPEILKLDEGQNLIGEVYDYAKLEDIQRAIKTPLADNGLSYRFNQKQRGNIVTVQCVISHIAGGSNFITMSAPTQETDKLVSEQITATTTSYLKRYTLINALGLIVANIDHDAINLPYEKRKKSSAKPTQIDSDQEQQIAPLKVPNDEPELISEIEVLEKRWETQAEIKRNEPRTIDDEHLLMITLEEDETERFNREVELTQNVVVLDIVDDIHGLCIYQIQAVKSDLKSLLERAQIPVYLDDGSQLIKDRGLLNADL